MKALDKDISNNELKKDLLDLLIDKMEHVYDRIDSGHLQIDVKEDTYKRLYDKLRIIWHDLKKDELVLLINTIKNQN